MKLYKDYSSVIIFYPVKNNQILMQLRDNKKNILFPNQWGFFSGSIEKNESFFHTYKRELKEELNIDLSFYDTKYIGIVIDRNLKIISYNFILKMQRIRDFSLLEGTDFKYVSKNKLKNQKLYSQKTKKYNSLIKKSFLKKQFIKVLKLL